MSVLGLSIVFTLTVLILADNLNDHAFPNDFMFGVATASYQIEGGWNADGKGENIWDRFVHDNPDRIKNHDNGDVACDSYHKLEEDVELLKYLGVTYYRFSLSWSRLFPSGFTSKINENGVNYYINLIQRLKENNIEPFVTLYHWDLPQPLQDLGGWPNDNVIYWFGEYARICFELFGDSVKYWMTFNEPTNICVMGYGDAMSGSPHAPGINTSGIGDYLCGHNLLRAHARAWHIYNNEYRATQKGKLGIVISSKWFQPATNSRLDIDAAEKKLEFMFGWWANPLLNGDYPSSMKSSIASRSQQQGFPRSRLPEFTDEEIMYLRGTVDLLGVNVYTSALARFATDPNSQAMGWNADSGVDTFQPEEWPSSASSWLKVTPWAIRYLTNWVKNTYNNPQIIITENGFSDNGTTLEDDCRINYIQSYLSNLRDAMEEDGVSIIGYTAWSLMDNFEWTSGYTEKFGLYRVDFSSPNRTRTAKKSAEYYRHVVKTKCIVDSCE